MKKHRLTELQNVLAAATPPQRGEHEGLQTEEQCAPRRAPQTRANPRNCTDTSGVLPAPPLHATMHSYRGVTPKTDGVLSPGEYDDAFTFTSPFTDGQMQWVNEFYPVLTPAELSLQGWIKHDHEALYLAFNISDDFLYAIQGDRWAPKANPSANCPRPPGAVKRH